MVKSLKVALISLVLFAIIFFVVWQVSKSRTIQFFGGIISSAQTDKKIVALTFDDGPTKNTRAALDLLDRLKVKATFFVICSELMKNPEEGRMIVLAGHELGNHSYRFLRLAVKVLPGGDYQILLRNSNHNKGPGRYV